jgi:uncharacterized metal-binding protein
MKNKQGVIEKALKKYNESETREIYIASAITEQNAYMMIRGRLISIRPRLLEIIKFSERMGWKKIGIAFCSGLANEAKHIAKILEDSDLEVHSTVCSCGGVDKSRFGVKKEHKIASLYGEPEKFEAGCNPIVQAEVLNSENLDLHILVGLCIGHDIIFTKYSKPFVTTLMVKDRVTGHNPMASIYSSYHNPRYYPEKN